MDRLLSMRVFQKVIDEGGFAAAARALDMSAAVVTRLVADLEDHLGVEPEASLAKAAEDAFGGKLGPAHAGLRRAAAESGRTGRSVSGWCCTPRRA